MNSRISLLASLLLFTPFASQAQQRVGLTPIATVVPQFGTPPSFGIETGITCPTPSLNSSGFAADADNWASYPDTTGGRTGYGNFGVLGGINIPFGGSLSRFCADYAAQKNKIQALNRQARELSNANFIITSCAGFIARKIDVGSQAFIDAFPLFAKCKDITARSKTEIIKLDPAPPSVAPTIDFPKATPVIIVP